MVCPRCIDTVRDIFNSLKIDVTAIQLGEVIVSSEIEKVKELLFYDELTLSEIAFQMNYSSVAHLSSQFKKETGMTTTEFKKQRKPGHRSLDSI